MTDQITWRAIKHLDYLLPVTKTYTINKLTDILISRSNAITVRQAARALKATVKTTKFTHGGSLQALCIPIKFGPKAERGLKYQIVVDPRKVTHNEDADPWAFLVGHEIGHIVADAFGSFGLTRIDDPIELWCSEFGRDLSRKLGPSRR